MKLKLQINLTLMYGDYSGLPTSSHKGPKKWKWKQKRGSERCDVRLTQSTIAGFEMQEKNHEPRNACGLQKLEATE